MNEPPGISIRFEHLVSRRHSQFPEASDLFNTLLNLLDALLNQLNVLLAQLDALLNLSQRPATQPYDYYARASMAPLMIPRKSAAFRLAPPTNAPSTSG